MKVQQIAGEIARLIREGKTREAKDLFYADNIVSVEGNGEKFEGIESIRRKSADWAAQVSEIHTASVSEPLIAAGHFALNIRMDISYKNGDRAVLDEIAVYEVQDEKIISEQFFFKS